MAHRKGQFEKGVVQPGAGRPKGCTNKITKEIRSLLTSFLSENYEEFITRFNRLDDREYCNTYIKAAQIIVPRPPAEKEETDKIEGIELRIVYPDGRVETKKIKFALIK